MPKTNLIENYADFVWPYGPMCFLPVSFETAAVPPDTLLFLKEHGLPRYTPLYVRFGPLENGLIKQQKLSEREGKDFYVIGEASPSSGSINGDGEGVIWQRIGNPNDFNIGIDSEGKVYSYVYDDDSDFAVEPDLIASSIQRFYARLVIYSQEFACLEPDKAATIRDAPKNADGDYPMYLYSDSVYGRIDAADPCAPVVMNNWDDFWRPNSGAVGDWYDVVPENW